MDHKEAHQICQEFANKHKVIFDDTGECGFGRQCVGINAGNQWVSFNPHSFPDYKPVPGFQDKRFYAPEGVNAYHKHECLAVLGRGPDAVIQLATWIKHLESLGEIEVAEFETGATGMQAIISGLIGKAIRLKKKKGKKP